MELIKTIGTYVLIGLGFLGVIIICVTVSSTRFNFYFFGSGLVLLIPTLVYLIIENRGHKSNSDKRPFSYLKETGISVSVDLTNCEIVSNDWTAYGPKKKDSVIAINSLSGNSYDNVQEVDNALSRIKYSCNVAGKRQVFISPAIAKDKVTLSALLELKSQTNIFIDRDNPKNYYFDLDFLESGG